jgi:hypothetical protein
MDDRLRASDADRDRAAAQLHVHFAAGRLTPDELDDRFTAVQAARTFGDLRRTLADLPGPAPGLQQADRLERGYRRLLACYPPRHRRVHEEQMLAVLMTAAPEGKRRPGLAEAAGLILGGLRVRCRRSRGRVAGWRGALALISAVAVPGLLAGAAFAAVNPPLPTSYGLVSTLPNVRPGGTQTEAAIADSRPVLAAAAQAVRPAMSLHALQSQVHILYVAGDPAMQISAQAATPAQAVSATSAVAHSYVAYVNGKNAPGGRILRSACKPHPCWMQASVDERGLVMPAASLPDHVLGTGGLGALCGALIGAIAAAALRRRRGSSRRP